MAIAPRRRPDSKWSRNGHSENSTATLSQNKRPKLSEGDLQKLAERMRTKFRWSNDPRPFQLLGSQAQLEGVDMIIQAPTGSGKTAVVAGPHVWESSKGKLTIMVSPLLALEEEIVRSAYTTIFCS